MPNATLWRDKNYGFHGNGRFSRKKASFTENVTARELGWSLSMIGIVHGTTGPL